MDIENMRPATKEERDVIDKYISSINVDAGFNIWDLQEQVKVYDAYRNKGYVEGYNQALEDIRDAMSYHQTGLTGYLTITPDELDKLYK